MSEIDKQSETGVGVVDVPVQVVGNAMPGSGVSRRRLMRAGLAAAPVMLALKSQSVLAADICIKPSSFSSLKAAANMTLSRAPNQGWTCYSHGYWKNTDHPHPYSTKETSYFLATTSGVSAGFTANPGGAYTGKTLQNVLDMTGNANNAALARHIVASFLTAVANSNNPATVLLTTTQCIRVWNTLNAGNTWSPVAGVNWTLTDTMAYFDYIY